MLPTWAAGPEPTHTSAHELRLYPFPSGPAVEQSPAFLLLSPGPNDPTASRPELYIGRGGWLRYAAGPAPFPVVAMFFLPAPLEAGGGALLHHKALVNTEALRVGADSAGSRH